MGTKPFNILVTGGAGHVGSSLVEALLVDPAKRVTVVDDLSTGRLANLPAADSDRLRVFSLDVNDRPQLEVLARERFDWIFHYAAMVGVQRTLASPLAVLRDLRGIENLLTLARSCGARRIVFASSSEVYGEPVEFPQCESTTPLNSRLPYAIVKNAGEAWIRAWQQEFRLDYSILRMFNTYGPRQSSDFVLPRFLAAASAGEDLCVHGDGEQSRSFLHVDDHVAFVQQLLANDAGANQTFNVGSDREVSILELARLVIELTGSSSRIRHLPPLPEGDMRRRLPDIGRMRAILHREPIDLSSGIRQMLAAGSH